MQKYAGDENVAKFTLSIPHPYEDGMAEEWIRSLDRVIDIPSNPGGIRRHQEIVFAVVSPNAGHVIGSVGLNVDEGKHETAEIGFWIGKPLWGQSYCTEAANAIINVGFETLGLNCTYTNHFVENKASGRVMKKLGMNHEGTLKQRKWKNGEIKDLEVYPILKREFKI